MAKTRLGICLAVDLVLVRFLTIGLLKTYSLLFSVDTRVSLRVFQVVSVTGHSSFVSSTRRCRPPRNYRLQPALQLLADHTYTGWTKKK